MDRTGNRSPGEEEAKSVSGTVGVRSDQVQDGLDQERGGPDYSQVQGGPDHSQVLCGPDHSRVHGEPDNFYR